MDVSIALIALAAVSIGLIAWLGTRRGPTKRKAKPIEIPHQVRDGLPAGILMMQHYYVEGSRFFNLASKDDGETWRVIEILPNNKTRILGDVTDVHPAVLRDREAWDGLRAYVREHGSIRLNDRKGVRLLRRCGFEVRYKA